MPEKNDYFNLEILNETPDSIEAGQTQTLIYRVTCVKTFGASQISGDSTGGITITTDPQHVGTETMLVTAVY